MLLVFIIGIFVEIIWDHKLIEFQTEYIIIPLQNNYLETASKNWFGTYTQFLIDYILDAQMRNLVILILFMAQDCINAFKVSFVYTLGGFVVMLINVTLGTARPFWVNDKIKSNIFCGMSFVNPHLSYYNLIFFWGYIIYLFLYKYNSKPNKWLIISSIILLATIFVTSLGIEVFFGQVYIH